MKLILTILFICLASTTKAQEDKTVTIPFRVAKQIQKELISKDSCFDMYAVSQEEIYLLGQNIVYKDKVIDTLTSQGFRLKEQLENERNLKITYKGIAEDCKIQYDALNTKSTTYKKFTKVVGFVSVAVIAGLSAVILLVK
jgi:predicted transcriptional regulator